MEHPPGRKSKIKNKGVVDMLNNKILAIVMSLFTVGGATCGVVANNTGMVSEAPAKAIVQNQATVENNSTEVKGSVEIDKDNSTATVTPANNAVTEENDKNATVTSNNDGTVAETKESAKKDNNVDNNKKPSVTCPVNNTNGTNCDEDNSCNTNGCGPAGAPSNCNTGSCADNNTCGTTDCKDNSCTTSPNDCTGGSCNTGNGNTISIQTLPSNCNAGSCPLTGK